MIITVAILVNIIAIGTQVEKDYYRLGKESHNHNNKILQSFEDVNHANSNDNNDNED